MYPFEKFEKALSLSKTKGLLCRSANTSTLLCRSTITQYLMELLLVQEGSARQTDRADLDDRLTPGRFFRCFLLRDIYLAEPSI